MPIESTIARLSKVTNDEKAEMFNLHGRYFCHVVKETFMKDMDDKDWVIILRDNVEIVGFSTLQIIRLSIDGAERVFLFSGDTIVDSSHWQDSALAGSFGHVMLRLITDNGNTPIYWFLISKGYRTYRFLPVYFRCFYPVYNRPTPLEYDKLIQTVARHKFKDAYDKDTGLVRHAGKRDRLKPEMCEVPEGRRNDPHVRFFLERNPTYSLGDELACLADISKENLNKYAWRVIDSTTAEWDE